MAARGNRERAELPINHSLVELSTAISVDFRLTGLRGEWMMDHRESLEGVAMRGILAGLLLLLCGSGANATLIAYWNFDGYLDSPSATTVLASAGVGTLTITGFPEADTMDEPGTTINETIPADLLTNNALSLRNPVNNGDYLQLAFSLVGFQDPVLTYVTKKTDVNGFDINQWSYSTDGGTIFTNFGAAVNPVTVAVGFTGGLVTEDFTGVGALTNQTSVILRYTFGGGAGSAGTRNDIDNIQINATTIIPEPSTFALVSLGLLGLVMSRRRSLGSPARS
jgi:hypothetical protein